MSLFRLFLLPVLLVGLVGTVASQPSQDDPNQGVRVALQAELEDFSSADWAQRAGPEKGPALTGYLGRLQTVAGDAQWSPDFRAGTIPLARSQGSQILLGVTVYRPSQPAVGTLLFVHGYLSHAANFAYTFQYFLDRGWNVVTLDLPGHGLSTGPRGDVDDFEEYGDAVATWMKWVWASQWPGPKVLMAHSLGSAACFEALRRPGSLRPDKVVFCAPLLRVDWHPILEFGEKSLGWWWKTLPSSFGWDQYLDGYTMPVHWFTALDRWLERLKTQKPTDLPLTIYSGDRDTVVEEAWNRAEYRRLAPAARYVLLPGKGHLFLSSRRDRASFHSLLGADLGLN